MSSVRTKSNSLHPNRPKFLWGDEGDPEINFLIIDGKYRMVVRPEMPLALPTPEGRS